MNKFAESFRKVIHYLDPQANSVITEENAGVKTLADWSRKACGEIDKLESTLADKCEVIDELVKYLRAIQAYANYCDSGHLTLGGNSLGSILRKALKKAKGEKCKTCGGTGFKPRDKHCPFDVCRKRHDGLTCHPNDVQCEHYIEPEPCPDCQKAKAKK